ncbi:MAG: DUF3179 domain-containing protein, partial [Bacteroidetes bacterium]
MLFGGCSKTELEPPPGQNPNPPKNPPANADEWLIPEEEVLDGGPGKDGIPSIDQPRFVSVQEADQWLQPTDLVVGVRVGQVIRAYPHIILDWHEIVNDQVDSLAIAVTYCPLTGTAIGWKRRVKGELTTFGVSGLLYQTNLMPYDRKTNSTWSQMRMQAVNGELIETEAETWQVVETSWDSWKSMYPDSEVLSTQTGFSRSYGFYPYGDYKTNHSYFLFPINNRDDRVPAKERVLGIRAGQQVLAFRFDSFANGTRVIQNSISRLSAVVAGNRSHNILVAYGSRLPDGTELSFEAVDAARLPVIMKDQEGNEWDVFGFAVSGPRAGQQLPQLTSLIGYWFTFP